MNKNLVLIGAALAMSLPWAGCNKSGKLDQSSAFTPPSGPVELKLKWAPGERIVQDMDMKQTIEFSAPGQPAPVKQDTTMGQEYGLTVLKENPDGGHEVEMDFLSARLSVTMGGKTMFDYNSAKKSPADSTDPVAGVFGKIVGSKIQFFLNATNGIERIEGIDEMMNRLQTGASARGVAPLKSMFNESYFRQLMSANRYMPPKAVQPGDTWPVQIEFPMGVVGTLVMNYDFTFKSWEMHGKRNCARLEFVGTIKSIHDANAKPTGMSLSIPAGNSSGVSWFDPELGIAIDTIANHDMSMVMNLPMNPRGNSVIAGQMQSITNQMNQAVTIKLMSVK